MNPLGTHEVKVFSEALEKIHSETDLAQFPARLFEVIESLIPDAFITLDEFNTRTGAARSAVNRPVDESWYERLRELAPREHPAFPFVMAGTHDAMQISDFLSEREFRRTALYHDVFRPTSVRHQILLPIVVPDHVAGIAISRWKKFSDEEAAVAQLLGSHIALAHAHAQTLTALRAIQREPIPTADTLAEFGLTPRESEVMHWIIQGKRDSEIGKIVGASVRTVEKHTQSILAKFGVETRTGAAMEAVRRSASRSALPT